MQQAVAVAQWDENIIYKCIAEKFNASVADVDAVVFDDTGFAKKGKHPRTGDFLAARIRHAYRSRSGYPPGDEQWLLIHKPNI